MMISAGADPDKARHAAACVAASSATYIPKYREWRHQGDAQVIDELEELGALATELLSRLDATHPRTREFVRRSVREDDRAIRYLELERTGKELLWALRQAAAKPIRGKGRPRSGPARALLHEAIRAWRMVVGSMPQCSANRIAGTREAPVLALVQNMVEAAAEGAPDRNCLVAALSERAFRSELSVVRKQFLPAEA